MTIFEGKSLVQFNYIFRNMNLSAKSKSVCLTFVLAFFSVLGFVPKLKAQPSSQETAEGYRAVQARPWLGVAIDTGKKGVLIKNVLPGTPAQSGGLASGDEILSIEGTVVKKPEQVMTLIQNKGVGSSVSLIVDRGGKQLTKTFKLVLKPDELELVRKQTVGKKLPNADVVDASTGKKVSLKSFLGKTLLIEFWATWCPACRESHPRLSNFAEQMKGKGSLEVLAVTTEEQSVVASYINKLKPKFQVLIDSTESLHQSFGVSSIPMIIVVDKAGLVRYATIGGGENLEESIKQAIMFSESR
jgi:thiol-disulfide isomerase/thioredoxin